MHLVNARNGLCLCPAWRQRTRSPDAGRTRRELQPFNGVQILQVPITVTPARRKVLYISEPYVQNDHCLLVRDDMPYNKVEELATAKIGMANVSIDLVNLRRVLPSAVNRIQQGQD